VLAAVVGLQALLVSPPSVAAATTVQWPQFRYGPARVAFNPSESLIGPSNVGTLVKSWNRPVPVDLLASPVISGSTMYLVSSSLTAVDTATGAIRWNVAAPPGSFYTESTPAVDAGEVVTTWNNGAVRAYGAGTGGVLWTTSVPTNVSSAGPGTPAVRNGIVYITTNTTSSEVSLYALDEATGTARWHHNYTDYHDASPPAVTATVLVQGLGDGTVLGLNPTTGSQLWSITTPGQFPGIGIQGSVAYVSESCVVIALRVSDGSTVFSRQLPGCASGSAAYGPALAYGLVYTTTNDHHIYAVDGTTGVVRWTASVEAGANPTVANGVVYRVETALQAFNAATGALLLNIPLRYYTLGDVDIGGGHVYITHGGFHNSTYVERLSLP
jgi:outer membrane protein assembly factor BamB